MPLILPTIVSKKASGMKLQIEAPMKPGDRLVIAGVRPDNQGKYVAKKGLGTFRIDGWGKPWNPIISFEVP